MESHLSSIPADVSLGEVPPLNRRRLVAFFNCYIQKTTSLLNDLSLQSEYLLIEMEKQMRVMDARLSIIERKVADISVEQSPKPVEPEVVVPMALPAPVERLEEAPTPVPIPVDNGICDKYIKMLKMGVPEQAVKLKMQSEGVDPALLSAGERTARTPEEEEEVLSDGSDSSVEFSDSD